MTKVITRFAPSPTGYLHVGNIRTALINWLYSRKNDGKFILRIDDTDLERSKPEYVEGIFKDLEWLGLDFDQTFNQANRTSKYDKVKKYLIEQGRLYPCFETQEEIELKRKIQLGSGKPPIYDRAALNLSADQIDNYLKQGRTPHYRFLIKDTPIKWQDMIKGEISYEGSNLGDPIVIREDGSMTYMLCSVIDDIEYEITHIVRGEDHVSNTALQIQMFEALEAIVPTLGHLSLIKVQDEKISKRIGGFAIQGLREELGFEPMAINSFFSLIGSSNDVTATKNLKDLVDKFDISTYSKSAATYMPAELERINHKLVSQLEFKDVASRLKELGLDNIDEQFWLAVRPNLQKLRDLKEWWAACYTPKKISGLDRDLLKQAAALFPDEPITTATWGEWTSKITEVTAIKGKALFLPLRLALTGMDHGPELKNILPIITREDILRRLS